MSLYLYVFILPPCTATITNVCNGAAINVGNFITINGLPAIILSCGVVVVFVGGVWIVYKQLENKKV